MDRGSCTNADQLGPIYVADWPGTKRGRDHNDATGAFFLLFSAPLPPCNKLRAVAPAGPIGMLISDEQEGRLGRNDCSIACAWPSRTAPILPSFAN
jgi:hypothetical protein